MTTLAMAFQKINTKVEMLTCANGDWMLGTTATISSTPLATDVQVPLWGIPFPSRLVKSDVYLCVGTKAVTISTAKGSGDKVLPFLGMNIPFRWSAAGNGDLLLTTATAVGARPVGDLVLSPFGVNLPIRFVKLNDGVFALAVATPAGQRAAGDVVASLWGQAVPSRLVGLSDGSLALGTTVF